MAITIAIGSIQLVNSTGGPVAGGAATGASTTPFSVRRGFTLRPAAPLPIYGGGAPFTPGASLAYSSYGNAEQVIPISVLGSDHENAVARLQELKTALSSGSQSAPAVFGIQETSSSTLMVTDILSGYVREITEEGTPFEAWESRTEIDAEIVLTHKPFWGHLTTGETVVNAQSIISGAFTGSPDNVVPFTTGSGDLISEGQPLNLSLTITSGTIADTDFYLGTIDSVVSDATTQTVTTSSTTTPVAAGTGDTIVISPPVRETQALKMRLFVTNATASANARWRIAVYVSNVAVAPFYISPWNVNPVATGAFDAGDIPANLFRDGTALTSIYVVLEVVSTGGSVTVLLSNFYVVLYYTMCRLVGIAACTTALSSVIHLRGFVESSGRPCMPLPRAELYSYNGANPAYYGRIEGEAPVYLGQSAGSVNTTSLFLYAIGSTGASLGKAVAGTFTLTARNCRLWKTLRGAD